MADKRIVILGWAGSVHIQRWVAGLCDRGYRVKLISLGGEKLKECETVIFPRQGKLSYLTRASAAAHEVRTFQPDLLHVHYVTGFGFWGLWAKMRPTLVSVWGADVIDFPRTWIRRQWVKTILSRATHITATSAFLKKTVGELLPPALNKTTVIPFGVSIPNAIIPPSKEGPIKLCYIKAHRPKYGPDILLKAFAQATKTIPDITLTMAGEGSMTAQLKSLVHQLGITEQVDFVGFIPNNHIYSFLRQHHIMVMPSVMDSESFGVAVVEAAACGRPSIASSVGGVPEVIEHEKTGLLVPPDNVDKLTEAIVELAMNPDKREKMGAAAYSFAKEKYDWNESLDKMTGLYERLIDESKTA